MNSSQQQIMGALALSSAVRAALETPLFASLLDGASSSSRARAQACGLDARSTHAVLEVLTAHGVCERDGDNYRASAALLAWRERTPGGADSDIAIWLHVPTLLRTGVAVGVRTDAELGALYKGVTSRLADLYRADADHLAEQVIALLDARPARVLDLGCGSGVWSIALAVRCVAHVIGVDRAPVLDTLRAWATERGVAERVEGRAGDLFSVPLEDGAYDVVVVANVVRLGDEEFARGVLARAVRACAPGGAVLVVDAFAGGDESAERARAAYGLHLVARSDAGRVYRGDEVARWLEGLGLARAHTLALSPPVGALLARAR